ncbi:hypothetical protein TWF281_011004 [Arthrobotrys megalospora]
MLDTTGKESQQKTVKAPEGIPDLVRGYNVCQMSGFQSVIVDQKLYILGDKIWYRPTEQKNEQLALAERMTLSLDLSKPFTSNNFTLEAINPPDSKFSTWGIENAVLFAGFHKMYRVQLSEVSRGTSNRSADVDSDSLRTDELFTFDTRTGSWSAEPLQGGGVMPSEHGSLVSIPTEELGFWVGGIVDSGHWETGAETLNQLRRFNMTSRYWEIEEASFGARVNGSTIFLPEGKQGILLNFAGQEYPKTGKFSPELISFDTVQIYNIANRRWYSQKTSGDPRYQNTAFGEGTEGTPRGRVNPCSVAVEVDSTSDSGHHIYMFGGSWENINFGEVWVLSVPGFRWTLVKRDNPDMSVSQCYLLGKSQILLLGGRQSTPDVCSSQFFKILDLNNLNWTDTYYPNSRAYITPKVLFDDTQEGTSQNGYPSPVEFVRRLLSRTPTPSPPNPRQGILSTSKIQLSSRIDDIMNSSLAVPSTQSESPITTSPPGLEEFSQIPVKADEVAPATAHSIHTTDSIHGIKQPTFYKFINISTTALPTPDQIAAPRAPSRHPTRKGSVTITSTVLLPQKTVTMHMTISNTNTKHSRISTSHKRKAITTTSAGISLIRSTETESPTKITITGAPPPATKASTTATEEDDTLSPTPKNLKPYQNTTGIIAGSVIGGVGILGGAVVTLIIYWCRTKRPRKEKRCSMSDDLLNYVPQKRDMHSVDIRDLPPLVTSRRKSRMDWVRFSKARGLHEVFEME